MPTEEAVQMTLGQALRQAGQRWPERQALLSEDIEMTWSELDAEVDRVARLLSHIGVKGGDVVGFMIRKRPEVVTGFLACCRIGAIMAPINFKLHPDHVRDQVMTASIRTVIVEAGFDDLLRTLLPELTDPQKIIYVDGPGRYGDSWMGQSVPESVAQPDFAAAPDTEAIAKETGIVDHVHVVPAFAGLGAPYWDADARAAILGMSRDTGIPEIVTATLQAVAYQTRDLVCAMADDGISPSVIRVDGGMVANDWFLQFLADVLATPVERPANVESTVLGAAYLAGYQAGVVDSLSDIGTLWQCNARFEPAMDAARRDQLLDGWKDAVRRVRSDN